MIPESLNTQAVQFAGQVSELLVGALPEAPEAEALVHGDRVVVQTGEPVRLFIRGEPLATLKVHLYCRLDSRGQWLAIEESGFGVWATVDRTPILRYDYLRDPDGSIPGAHLQVHAHRGALSHLLSRSSHDRPHDMSALHMPVGGSRFRPCLEDVVEFLITELRVDACDGWRAAVEAGRERWRRTQLNAVVRDLPEVAAEQLRNLGYEVRSPDRPPDDKKRALHIW